MAKRGGWREEIDRLDGAVFSAVAARRPPGWTAPGFDTFVVYDASTAPALVVPVT